MWTRRRSGLSLRSSLTTSGVCEWWTGGEKVKVCPQLAMMTRSWAASWAASWQQRWRHHSWVRRGRETVAAQCQTDDRGQMSTSLLGVWCDPPRPPHWPPLYVVVVMDACLSNGPIVQSQSSNSSMEADDIIERRRPNVCAELWCCYVCVRTNIVINIFY